MVSSNVKIYYSLHKQARDFKQDVTKKDDDIDKKMEESLEKLNQI